MKHLAHNIQQLLASSGVRVSRLAQLTGVNQPTLYRIVNSDSQSPRESTLQPLADFLGIPVGTLCYTDLRLLIKQKVKNEESLVALRDRTARLLDPGPIEAPQGPLPTGNVTIHSAGYAPLGSASQTAYVPLGSSTPQAPPSVGLLADTSTQTTIKGPPVAARGALPTTVGGAGTPRGPLSTVGLSSVSAGAPVTGGLAYLALGAAGHAQIPAHDAGIGGLPHGLLNIDPASGGIASLVPRQPRTPEEEFRARWRTMQRPMFNALMAERVPSDRLEVNLTLGPHQGTKRFDYVSDRIAVDLRILGPFPAGALPASQLDEINLIRNFSFRNLADRIGAHLFNMALLKKARPELRALLVVMACKLPLDDDPGVEQARWEAEQFGVELAFAISPAAATRLICQLEGLAIDTGEEDDGVPLEDSGEP